MMSAVLASPSQYVLQYLLSGLAKHRQLGWAHFSLVFIAEASSVEEHGGLESVTGFLAAHLLPRRQAALRGLDFREPAAFLLDQVIFHAAHAFSGLENLG